MQLPQSKGIKWVVRLLGLLLLGAVGSGLWEVLVRPVWIGLRDVTLNVVSLGLHSLKDGIYSEVALGLHGSEAFAAYAASLLILNFMALAYSSHVMMSYRRTKSRLSPDGQKTPPAIRVSETVLRQKVHDNHSFLKSTRRAIISLHVVIALLAGFLVGQCVVLFYENSAITHFIHTRTVLASHLSEGAIAEFDSRFAQISSRSDYVRLLAEMEKVARAQNLKVRDFEAW